jgi:hypothetical protein
VRKPATLSPAKPSHIIAQVDGSGIAGAADALIAHKRFVELAAAKSRFPYERLPFLARRG